MLVRSINKDDYSPKERAFIIVLALVFTGIGLYAIMG
jgi:hypothetical protein